MSFRLQLLLVLALFVATGFGQAPVDVGHKRTLHSAVLNEDRTFQVCLPASYHWALDRSYPVLYILDGESHFLHAAGSATFLASKGEIPELIVVAITSTVRIRDYTQTDWSSHWVGGGGAEHFKRFLSTELIPAIERTYRTNRYRILWGHSAGGQFVLYALSSEPSLFNAYIALSPSLDWDNNLPQRSLEQALQQTDSLRAFLYFAWSDDSGQALADDQRLQETVEKNAPKGFRWATRGFPDETHTSIPLVAHIDGLRRLYAGYRFPDDLLEKGLAYAEHHFGEVSGRVGYTIPVPEDVVNNLGYEELAKGNVHEAIELFKRNTRRNPHSANALDGIADAYDRAGMRNEAMAAMKKAVDLATRYKDPNLRYFTEHLKRRKSKPAPALPK